MKKYNLMVMGAFLCIPLLTVPIGIPEWIKTAAGVGYTTLSKSSPKTKDEVLSGSLPTSTTRMWGTAGAALCATLVTNQIVGTTATYRLLDQTTRRIARRYTNIPPWARKRLMPGLSFVASNIFYGALFQALHEPACTLEQEVTTRTKKDT